MKNKESEHTFNRIFDQLEINDGLAQPIASQLAEQLTWFIASGQILPGEKLIPVSELATRLKISIHTVLAAYRILEETKLVTIKQGRGTIVQDFYPCSLIRENLDFPTHTVGFIAPDLSSPFYREIYRGLQDIAAKNHFLLISCGTGENPKIAREQLNMLIAKRVDGLIIVSDYLLNEDDPLSLPFGNVENCPVPIVYVDRPDEHGNTVIFDAERVGFIATEHLIEHKHTHVGLIINNRKFPTSRDCYQGYLNALNHYHLEPKNEYIVEADAFTIDAGYKAVETLFSQTTTLPTALFIAEDTLAVAAIRALKDRGIRVPQDVAIVGMNNFTESVYSDPRITSVDTSAIDMGERAMAIIVRIIRGEKIESIREILPVKLVKRESCGCEVRS